jgi:hypothetical protein
VTNVALPTVLWQICGNISLPNKIRFLFTSLYFKLSAW